MRRLKNIFSSLMLTFAMLGCLGLGISLTMQGAIQPANFASAEDLHSLRDFVKLDHDDNTMALRKDSQNVDYVYLVESGSTFGIKVATDEIQQKDSQLTNFAYITSGNEDAPITYDYFHFENIHLFKGVNKTEVDESSQENLFSGQNKSFTIGGGFALENGVNTVTPETMRIDFGLGQEFSVTPISNENGVTPAKVTLNDEGLYTLRVTLNVYHISFGANGDAIIVPDSDKNFDFTFMIFNRSTYLEDNRPHVTSQNAEVSNLSAGQTYSRYYFYHYEDKTLPSIKFDPKKYSVNVNYTDENSTEHTVPVEYTAGEQPFVLTNVPKHLFNSHIEGNDVKLAFNDAGEYRLNISYIYTADNAVYTLPITVDREIMFVFGYQIFYTDLLQENADRVEFKKFENDYTSYSNSADITALVKEKLETAGTANKELADAVLEALNGQADFKVASTNQAPIRFANNITPDESKIWKVTKDGDGYKTDETGENFDWLNMNTEKEGTYLIIAKFSYQNYHNNNGQPEGKTFYQAFLFSITSKTSTVSSYTLKQTADEENQEYALIGDNTFVNRNVFIVDNSLKSDFDARLLITISGVKYDGTMMWEGDRTSGDAWYGTELGDLMISRGEREISDSRLAAFGIHPFNQEMIDGELSDGYKIEADGKTDGSYVIRVYHKPDVIVPSTTTIKIDTESVGNVFARSVRNATATTYSIGQNINGITNGPVIFSWEPKKSNATVKGYVKRFPIKTAQFYTDGDNGSILLQLLKNDEEDLLPVNAFLDMTDKNDWSPYSNTYGYNNILPNASAVRQEAGLYIVQILDEAGNTNFGVFIIDDTAPIFVQQLQSNNGMKYDLLTNSATVAVSDAYEKGVTIRWANDKGIYIKGYEQISSILPYNDKTISEEDRETFKNALTQFLSTHIKTISGMGSFSSPDKNAFEDVNGTYLAIKVDNNFAFKDGVDKNSSGQFDYELQTGKSKLIPFFDETGGQKIAREGTFSFLLRDESNSNGLEYANEIDRFKNYPSAYLTLNLTSDSSRTSIRINGTAESNEPDKASYSFTGTFFKDNDGKLSKVQDQESGTTQTSNLTYKNTFYTPVKARRTASDGTAVESTEMYVSFIPVAKNGSRVEKVMLYYYPFVKANTTFNMTSNPDNQYGYSGTAYATYYTISDTPENVSTIFPRSNSVQYTEDAVENINIARSQSGIAEPGMYVIVRTYSNDNTIDTYDYYERTLTIIIDKFNVISSLESVRAVKDDGNTVTDEDGNVLSSSESIVGGDILISMFSGFDQRSGINQSNVNVSFPYINSNGLNSESLALSNSQGGEPASSFSTNKLPLAINVPSVKYTTHYEYNKEYNRYGIENGENTKLTRYVQTRVAKASDSSAWQVLAKDVVSGQEIVIASFNTETEANAYQQDTAVEEYKLTVNVRVVSGGITYQYASNGSTTNGYLNLYRVTNGQITGNPIINFDMVGTYVVTIEQASNQANTEGNFKSSYSFKFEVQDSVPDFDIAADRVRVDDYVVNDDGNEVYYVNSPYIHVSWTDPQNERLLAKINPDSILVNDSHENVRINEDNHSFDIDLQSYPSCWGVTAVNDLKIYMELEGYQGRGITKFIHVDMSAPLENLNAIMQNLENSYTPFNRFVQEKFMRTRIDAFGRDIEASSLNASELETELQNVSYSFSITNENDAFKNYAYNLPKRYFDNLAKAEDYSGAQHYYVQRINSIRNYTQTTRDLFRSSRNSYTDLLDPDIYDRLDIITPGDYYEVVETDLAGNMVVYVVHIFDENDESEALSFTNATQTQDQTILDKEIVEGGNIFSTSGFEFTKLNYKDDPWGIYQTQTFVSATSSAVTTYYMKSPALNDDGLVYPLRVTNQNIILGEPVTLSSLFSSVDSSPLKHRFTMMNRFEGNRTTMFLTIWNGGEPGSSDNLTIDSKSSNENSATLTLRVPNAEQVASTSRSYLYPVEIRIYRYDNASSAWPQDPFFSATNITGDPALWESQNTGIVTITYTAPYLTIVTTILSSEELKYEFIDNFGHVLTDYQHANAEVILNEVEGKTTVNITHNEPDNYFSTTYLSSDDMTFYYDSLSYSIIIKEVVDGQEIEYTFSERARSAGSSVMCIDFTRSAWLTKYPAKPYLDGLYRIYKFNVRKDSRDLKDADSVLQIRLYDRLPKLNNQLGCGIWFNDTYSKQLSAVQEGSETVVEKDGRRFRAKAYNINSYSNVRIFFDNPPQDLPTEFSYQKQYPYSVWWKATDGNWENITDRNILGHVVSQSGQLLVCYDSEVFGTQCDIYNINLLSSISQYYTVIVTDATGKQTIVEQARDFNSPDRPLTYYHYQYNEDGSKRILDSAPEVYLVSVPYQTASDRVRVEYNTDENINVTLTAHQPFAEQNGVYVQYYDYNCNYTNGRFAIIYIGSTSPTRPLLQTLRATNADESVEYDLPVVVPGEEGDKLKVTYSDHYGIEENKIHVSISKLFVRNYQPITVDVASVGDQAFFYLDRSGSYQISFYDSCSPANYHYFEFAGSDIVMNLIYLADVPFHVTYADATTGETVETEPIDHAVYNSAVTLTLQNMHDYYNAQSWGVLAYRNGRAYSAEQEGNNYTFSEPGFYKVTFVGTQTDEGYENPVYKNGSPIQFKEYSFTIINKDESRFAYEFAPYSTGSGAYYITDVVKDGRNITNELIALTDTDIVIVNGERYLSRLLLSNDDRTGLGRYTITVHTALDGYAQMSPEMTSFTFSVWINEAIPPYTVSVAQGETSTSQIVMKFNAYNLYQTIGDCYIQIGSQTVYVNADTVDSLGGENAQLSITRAGTYYIQIYTMSGTLLDSYKVIKKDPLNAWAIIAIVLGSVTVVAVVVITILLRKKLRVK